jgi:hypothetical protein
VRASRFSSINISVVLGFGLVWLTDHPAIWLNYLGMANHMGWAGRFWRTVALSWGGESGGALYFTLFFCN